MQVLYGEHVLPAVRDLITNAEAGGELRLVTGYFDPKESLKESLERALDRGVRISLITRGGRSEQRHSEAVAEFEKKGMQVRYLPWLHAKLYISSTLAISTSMNLTENSAHNSGEMAVCIGKNAAVEDYRLMCAAFEHFREKALLHEMESRGATQKAANPESLGTKGRTKKKEGHCIRCNAGLPLDREKPLCRSCYGEWAKYENTAYKEKFCHECGAAERTSMSKPICRACSKS